MGSRFISLHLYFHTWTPFLKNVLFSVIQEKINKDVFENQIQSFTTKNQGLQSEVNKLQDLIDNMDADMITLKEKIERSESIIKQLQSFREEEKVKFTTALEDEKEQFSNLSNRLQSFVNENETILKQVRVYDFVTHCWK